MNTIKTAGTLTLLSIASLTIMVGCVIVPGLTSIASHLGVPHAAGWLVTLPSLGVVLFGPMAGRLIQRKGAYSCLTSGLILYGVLGGGGVFLRGVPLFIDRLLLGGATAMIMASGTGLISVFFTGQERLTMIARQGMSIELGGVIFLSIGGMLASRGWQWPFLLYLMAWVFGVMLLLFVPRPQSTEDGDGDKAADGAPGRLGKTMMATYMTAALAMIVFFVGIIFIPGRLGALDLSTSAIGFFMSFISLIAVVSASQMPRCVGKIGSFGTLIFAFCAYAGSHILFYLAASLPVYFAAAVLIGMGFGLSVPLVNHMAIEFSPARVRGRNLAYLSVAIFGGQFMSGFMEFFNDPRLPFLGAFVLSVLAAIALKCMGPSFLAHPHA